jgi:hypothetical protein
MIDPLSPSERAQAISIFRIINSRLALEPLRSSTRRGKRYDQSLLLQLVLDHALSDSARDSILRYFLTAMAYSERAIEGFPDVLEALDHFEDMSVTEKETVLQRAKGLADDLIVNFFLPCKLAPICEPSIAQTLAW